MNVANEKMAYEVNSNAARNYNSSPNCDHTEPTQENQYTSSSATDFTFYNSQLFNPVMAPAERSLQMPNLNTFPDSMVTEKLLTLLLLPTSQPIYKNPSLNQTNSFICVIV